MGWHIGPGAFADKLPARDCYSALGSSHFIDAPHAPLQGGSTNGAPCLSTITGTTHHTWRLLSLGTRANPVPSVEHFRGLTMSLRGAFASRRRAQGGASPRYATNYFGVLATRLSPSTPREPSRLKASLSPPSPSPSTHPPSPRPTAATRRSHLAPSPLPVPRSATAAPRPRLLSLSGSQGEPTYRPTLEAKMQRGADREKTAILHARGPSKSVPARLDPPSPPMNFKSAPPLPPPLFPSLPCQNVQIPFSDAP
jgi:hypothetical protein